MRIIKIAIIVQFLAGILVLSLLGVYFFVQYNVTTIEKQTYAYLLNKYDSDEIHDVHGTIGKGQLFVATVEFEDEKDVVYEYVKIDGKIAQNYPSVDTKKFKHSEFQALFNENMLIDF